MWKAVQIVKMFNNVVNKDCIKDGTKYVWKKLKEAIKESDSMEGTVKNIIPLAALQLFAYS